MTRRRDVLCGIAGAGLASTVPLAGCTGFSPGGTGEKPLPAYHRFVPAEGSGDEGVFFATLDVAGLRELEEDALEEDLPEGSGLGGGASGGEPDPLLAYPAAGIFVVALGVSFGLFPYGFGEEISFGLSEAPVEDGTESSADGETETADDASRIDSMVLVPGAVAMEGSFDEDRLAEAASGFARDGEHGGYATYVGGEGESMMDTGDLAFAVDGETLFALIGDDHDDPRVALEAAIDVANGDAERLADDADAEWALRTAGHGFSVLGGWGTDPDEVEPTDGGPGGGGGSGGFDVESVLDDARGLVSSLAVDGTAGTTTATVAAVYPEGETPTREQLEADLGASATEREVEVDGTRVAVTATWSVEETTDA